jgi:hypothetical protein
LMTLILRWGEEFLPAIFTDRDHTLAISIKMFNCMADR